MGVVTKAKMGLTGRQDGHAVHPVMRELGEAMSEWERK